MNPLGHLHKIRNLGKLMSYILKHRPDEFGLVLDEDGYIPLKELHRAIVEEEGWSSVRPGDILQVVHTSEKERFLLDEKRIRADYGDSLPVKREYTPSSPPKVLYHGARQKAYPSILSHGLRSMARQYVHLTVSKDLALRIGRRRDPAPVLLTIHAQHAHQEGFIFYKANELIYLVEALPSEYLNGPPLPKEDKEKKQKQQAKEKEIEIPEHLLFAQGLHPHKDLKKREKKSVPWKTEARKYRRQKKR